MSMRYSLKACLPVAALACAPIASATTENRAGAVIEVQLDAADFPDHQNHAYVRIAGTWANAACNQTWAYFNSQENPRFLATAFIARTTGEVLRIMVDDARPKSGNGICQITNMSL